MPTGFMRRGLAVVAIALGVAVPTAFAGATGELVVVGSLPSADSTTPVAESTNLWFVQLKSAPAVKGTSVARLNSEKQAFRAEAADAGVTYTERFAFNQIWNGLSVRAEPHEVSTISRLPSVAAVYPVLVASIPPTSTISPDLATAINMTGANEAQDAGHTGAGVKVAVMDTGVDYDHADLGGDGVNRENSASFPTRRVVAGHDFVGDAYNADSSSPAFNPNPSPDARPDDCNGHGTHVAGIVGANPASPSGVKGVAPGVTFGAYRVFGCAGSTTADIMLAAMERSKNDGMHVLNMSIGSAFNTWDQYPTSQGSNNLVASGMVVVASIGNSGANGTFSAGSPGVGKDVIGVASFDNSHVSALTFDTNPTGASGSKIAYLQIGNSTEAPTSGTTPEIVYVGRGCPQAGPSWSLPQADPYLADPNGKVALIDRGVCTFEGKYQRAIDAGAVAVVVANNAAGLFSGGGITDRGFPAVGISLADGNTLKSQIANNAPVTLTWTSERLNAPNPTGGIISTFSSFGLGAELDLKPDIGAPGGLIRSTYPLQRGAYAIVSGTSMSSPHVAGAVAQLLQARPGTSPADVRTLLQNSADPRAFSATSALLDNVHRQGAGMLDIDDSILAPTLVTPGKLVLGEAGPAFTGTLTLANRSGSAITYDLAHQAALSTFGSTFAPSLTTSGATAGGPVTFSQASVTVPAGGTATVNVTIPRPDFGAANKLMFGGWIRFTPQGGGQVLRVPYAGFGADYQGFPVMAGTGGNNEVQSVAITGSPTGGSFTLTYTPLGGGDPETTAPIAHDATAAAVRTALAALPSIGGTGNVATAGGPLPGTAVSVTFTGALGLKNVNQMTADGAGLTGGTDPAVVVSTTTQGVFPYPKLAKRVGFVAANNYTPTYSLIDFDSVTYTMEKTNVFGRLVADVPTVAVHLDHQVRSLKVTVLTAAGNPVSLEGGTTDPVGIVSEYLPRNSTSGGFFAFGWDGKLAVTNRQGKTELKKVPDGNYKLKVDILKAGGTAGTAGHTETYTSQTFTIDRPGE
ncbi:MAG: S8 family serine peptidase [Thermoleophilia bacterium]|nr:S8 family serine peptidase [Thermoleophilia bacterium]